MPLDKLNQLLRIFKNDTPLGAILYKLLEAPKIRAFIDGFIKVVIIIAYFVSRKRKRRANFNAPLGPDMKTHAHCSRAKCFARCSPITINNDDRMMMPECHHFLSGFQQLLWAKAVFRMRIFAHWPVKIVPDVHCALLDHQLQEGVAQNFLHVFACDCASNTKNNTLLFKPLHSLHC